MVSALVGPSHLLLLGHSVTHQQIHRRLRDAATDRQSLAVPGTVVDQCRFVVVDVEIQSAQVPPQGRVLVLGSGQQLFVDALDPGYSLEALAVPDEPLGLVQPIAVAT